MIYVVFALIATLALGYWQQHRTVQSYLDVSEEIRKDQLVERTEFEVERRRLVAAVIARNPGEAGRALRDHQRPEKTPVAAEDIVHPYGL